MTLRQRIVLALTPLVCLLALLGATGLGLLHHIGNRIEDILRENYASVEAMFGLNEAVERIDSSFQFALQGKEDARLEYDANWLRYNEHLDREAHNVTEAGEQELVDRLELLTEEYRKKGDQFWGTKAQAARAREYFGGKDSRGLLHCFRDIKEVAGAIRKLNQDSMVRASARARRTAQISQLGLGLGLAATAALAGLLIWGTTRSILRPIQGITHSALAIGAGNLNQVVPVVSHDEIGHLADAFNNMARQLRAYRDSHSARLLRAQRTSQATIDSFPEPVLVVDPAGRVEMANPAANRLLGVSQPPPGQSATDPWLPPPPLRQPLEDALQKQRPFLTQAFDQTVAFRCDGEERVFLPQILPIQDPFGNTLGAAVMLNDVTRFRLLDQIKSDLVATVSHELKTPLTSVRLVLHLLLEEVVGPLTPKQTELLMDARDNAERLLNLIEHLLALARLEEGREPLQVQETEVKSLLQTAAEAARPRAEAKHIELVVEDVSGLPPLAVDPLRLGHALGNLLDNALAYTDQGGRVTLGASPNGEGSVRLCVADSGAGIPAEHLPHVFDRFFRVPEQSRGQGTGLGLAIVQEIVQAHGGQITCESAAGKGTTFYLTLPVWRPKETEKLGTNEQRQ